jgi:hypothetical protein
VAKRKRSPAGNNASATSQRQNLFFRVTIRTTEEIAETFEFGNALGKKKKVFSLPLWALTVLNR